MKKIIFLSSTKLLIVTMGLIIGAFVTLSMTFPDPAYSGPNVSGPKMAHWTTTSGSGCNTSTTYHNTIDHAKSTAKTTGHGTVEATSEKGTSSGVSGSENGNESYVEWDCGYTDQDQTGSDNSLANKHKNNVTFTATPDPGYIFIGWKKENGDELSKENPCKDVLFDMGITNYASAEKNATKYPSNNPYIGTIYYAHFAAISVTAPTSVDPVVAYVGDLAEGTIVFTISDSDAEEDDFNAPVFTSTAGGTWTVTKWIIEDDNVTVFYSFMPETEGTYNTGVTLMMESKGNLSASATIPVTVSAASTKYYSQVTAKLSTKSADDSGDIWVAKTESMTGAEWSTSDQVVSHISYNTPEATTYYLHAQSKDPNKYIFVGWYRTDACALTDLLSLEADYPITITPTSTDAVNPTAQIAYARFIRLSEHYLEVTALPNKAGLGMVYATETAGSNPAYSLYSPEGSKAMCEVMSMSQAAVNGTIYVHAYPKYGYKFDGWFTNAECTGAAVSTNAHYAYSAEAISTDPVVPTTKTLYAKFSVASPINITFNYPENGTYSASVRDIVVEDGEYVWGELAVYNSQDQTANATIQMYPSESITLKATPDAGMAVKSWKDGSATVKSGSRTYTTSATAAKTFAVTMDEAAPFKVGSTTYSDLHDAIKAAGSNKTIIVVEDCWIQDGDYTIPSGVTLLIPHKEDNTSLLTTPDRESTGSADPVAFRRIELAPNANIILNGNLGLSGTQSGQSSGAPGAGAIIGGFGCLDMSKGGNLTIKNGGKLYAYGFIVGAGDESNAGTITVESGGEVYECFVLMDVHGGGGTAAIVNGTSASNSYGVFPFNQFYVQNIEPRMTLMSGATETVRYYIYASADAAGAVKFISANSDSFFGVSAGSSITKWYDYTTDRQCYEMNGIVNINSITVSMKFSITTMSINSSNFILPIGNFDFTLPKGAAMTLTNDVEMLPGARITIAQGANLTIAKSLYLYDYTDWGYYCANGYVVPITKTPGHNAGATARKPDGTSTLYKMGQAELIIDGTVIVGESGRIYTTTGGAKIYSHGTGELIYNNAIPEDGTNLYKIYGNYGKGASGSFTAENAYNGTNVADGQIRIGRFGLAGKNYGAYGYPIPCTPAVLRNANGSVYQTAGKAAGTTVRYVLGQWMVLSYSDCLYHDEIGHLYTFTDEDDFTEVIVSPTYPKAWEMTGAPNILFIHTADNCDWVKVNAVPEVASTTKLLKDPETNIYYQYNSTKGYWEVATSYTVTFKNYNGKVLLEDKIYPGGVPTYKGLTQPVRPEDETGIYTFAGWKVNGEGETVTSFAAVNDNVVYVAQYDHTANVTTVNSLGVTTYYTTWASALAFANAQNTTPTLKLLSDVSGISAVQTISKSMTLDLNGHTLSGTVSEMLKVNSAITLTITDGSAEQTGVISSVGTATSGNHYTISIDKCKLILEKGTLKGKANGAAVFPIHISSASTFEMLGGRITTDATGTNNHGMLVKTKNTFIKGGTIDVPGAAVYISSGYSGTDKMTISGGYIKGGTIINSGNSADTRVNVTGGYFSTDASLSSLVATPYHIFDNEEESKTTYPYIVAEGYNVIFRNGDDILQSGILKVGTTPAYEGAIPTKTADAQYTYTFSTWSPALAVVTGEATYTAQFNQTLNKYTVIWDAAGGTLTGDYTNGLVDYGTRIVAPAVSKTGYDFAGWGDIPETVTGNVRLTAKWNPIAYTITYTGLEGASNSNPTSYTIESATINFVTPGERIGYTFQNWSPTSIAAGSTGNKTVTASWTINQYTVTFKNGEDVVKSGDCDYASVIVAPADPEKTGYTFSGWYNGENKFVAGATVPVGGITYEAHWTINKYTLAWNLNGGEVKTAGTAAGTVAYNTKLTAPVVEKTGYTFAGWSPDVPTTMPAANATYTAQWTANQYTITFNSNGGTSIDPINGNYGDPISAPADPTREGYTFAGWSEDVPSTMPAENKTLTASWTVNQYTITYEGLEGATNSNPTSYTIESATIDFVDPGERAGYTFNGWTPASIATGSTGKKTVTASWTKNSQTVTDIEAGDGNHATPNEATDIDVETNTTTMTVHADGVVNMNANINVSNDLILEATTDASGEIIPEGAATLTVSGNAYFDLSLNIKARQWYAVAVPWQVDATTGISIKGGKTLALGTDEDVVYYNGSVRAAQGATADCIKYLEDEVDKTMYPGKMYFLFFAQNLGDVTLRFTKKEGTPVLNNSVSVATYLASNTGDANWNGIANPTTYKAYLDAGATRGYYYSSDAQGYMLIEKLKNYQYMVGSPVMLQATSNSVTISTTAPASSAPYRVMDDNQSIEMSVVLSQNDKLQDRIVVQAEAEKEDAYVLGTDLAKPSVSTRVAQMWIDRYNTKLAVNAVEMTNNVAEYPLTLSAPQAGEFQLSATGSEDATLYLTQNGVIVWNLSMSDYTISLPKGTTTGYGLRLVRAQAPGTATSIDEAQVNAGTSTEKVVVNGILYILHDGKVYDAQGHMLNY